MIPNGSNFAPDYSKAEHFDLMPSIISTSRQEGSKKTELTITKSPCRVSLAQQAPLPQVGRSLVGSCQNAGGGDWHLASRRSNARASAGHQGARLSKAQYVVCTEALAHGSRHGAGSRCAALEVVFL